MEPLKNLFSPQLIQWLGFHLEQSLDGFDRKKFETTIIKKLNPLELKQRSQLIADEVHEVLPRDCEKRYAILLNLLHPEIGEGTDQKSDEKGIRGWAILPLTLVVAQHGLEQFEQSMALLREMTKRFTSEFAIRYFILHDQSRALGIMMDWLDDPSHHVRRLVCEGSRPRLPWAMQLPQLIQHPDPVIPILTALRDDPSSYVRRSVANHLNDIAKDHPDRVAELAINWMKDADANREKLVRHGCRTLIKQGHELALSAFGIMRPKIKPLVIEVTPSTIAFGTSFTIRADIISTTSKPQRLVVDYCLHFKKANGNLSAKTFKGSQLSLKGNDALTFTKTHTIKAITTRRYYPGKQGVSLRINGEDFGFTEFLLTMKK